MNAWDPWPPASHSVGEKPGKAGSRGAETCGRKRRTHGKRKKLCKARCLSVRVSKIPGKGKKSSTGNWNFLSSQPICHYFWVNSQTWGPFPSVQQPMLVAFAWAGKPILTSFMCDKATRCPKKVPDRTFICCSTPVSCPLALLSRVRRWRWRDSYSALRVVVEKILECYSKMKTFFGKPCGISEREFKSLR